MSKRILIIDTSIFCCWLQVPGKETAGPLDDRWDFARTSKLMEEEHAKGSTFVLPMATLIETGNHIAQSAVHRFERAEKFAEYLRLAADAQSPWAAFAEQSSLWQAENLTSLADNWPQLAAQRISIGDATIKDVAEYYARAGMAVEIITGDAGLKAHQPSQPVAVPRRRR